MNDQAQEALGRVIRTYGASICQTPRSCEMFVRQECGAFPQESHLLVEALRQGVATELLSYRPDQPWSPLHDELCSRLRKQAKIPDADGAWAIETWARALGRHPEAWQNAPEALAVQTGIPVDGAVSKSTLRHAMTAIAALGGGLGGGIGSMLVPSILLVTQASTVLPLMGQRVSQGNRSGLWLTIALILTLIFLIGGFGGALGAGLGWRYGKGDRAPWTAFSAAFGATLTSGALGSYFCTVFGGSFLSFVSGFGAATTMARRGGFDR